MQTHPSQKNYNQGFTLIELSIVLVIIGLIVGGVLVGQDLIKAAQIRATITQLDAYDSAANTFRGKYNGLPGDLTNAANFGFTAAGAGTNVTAGNNVIEGCTGNNQIGCETEGFWYDLAQASLIGDTINQNSVPVTAAALTSTAAGTAAGSPAGLIPVAKLGSGNFLAVGANSGINYYYLSGVTAINLASVTNALDLTPQQAFQIDTKKDDGIPDTGIVLAFESLTMTEATPTTTNCMVDKSVWANGGYTPTAGNAYQTTTQALANSTKCWVRIRTSF